MRDHLEHVAFKFKQTLLEQGELVANVYFPTSGVVSLVTVMNKGDIIETGTVGREGFVGVPVALGAKRAPARAICQVAGEGFRLSTAQFLECLERSPRLRSVVLLYTHAVLAMVAQTAGCNRAHGVEARLARWLLMTHDRVEGDEFPLTQEFLAQMLGVRRSAINIAGRRLQQRGVIDYTRGRITVLDRTELERSSCECYDHIRQEFIRVLGDY